MYIDRKTGFAEVQFYFQFFNNERELEPRALVSVYSPPNEDMLQESFQTLWACHYSGNNCLRIVQLSEIISVVSMQPLPRRDENDPINLWFVVEKPGLDDVEVAGINGLFHDDEN